MCIGTREVHFNTFQHVTHHSPHNEQRNAPRIAKEGRLETFDGHSELNLKGKGKEDYSAKLLKISDCFREFLILLGEKNFLRTVLAIGRRKSFYLPDPMRKRRFDFIFEHNRKYLLSPLQIGGQLSQATNER